MRGVDLLALFQEEGADKQARHQELALTVLPRADQADLERRPALVLPFAEGLLEHEALPAVERQSGQLTQLERVRAGRGNARRYVADASANRGPGGEL